MTDDMHRLHENIGYMRRLAEQGRHGPILGGVFLLAAGAIFGTTCFIHWFALTQCPSWGAKLTPYLWHGAAAVFWLLWIWLYSTRIHGRPCARSQTNATFGLIWIACAIGVTVECVVIWAGARALNAPATVTLIMPTVFAFYGMAWFATAAQTRQSWMYGISAASFVSALVLAFTTFSLTQLLVMGLALYLTLALPGLKLVWQEPNA